MEWKKGLRSDGLGTSLDPFEAFSKRASDKRMEMAKTRKLRVISGNALGSGTTPATLQNPVEFKKRRILSDITNRDTISPSPTNGIRSSFQKMEVRKSVLALHNTNLGMKKVSEVSTDKVSVFHLSKLLAANSQNLTAENITQTNLLQQYLRHRSFSVPFSQQAGLSQQIYYHLKYFMYLKKICLQYDTHSVIGTFVQDEFDVEYENTGRAERIFRILKSKACKATKQDSYSSKIWRIDDAVRIGDCMLSVKVVEQESSDREVVILGPSASQRLIQKNDKLLLNDRNCLIQKFNGKEVKVFMKWHLL